jgi:hypothetical protein
MHPKKIELLSKLEPKVLPFGKSNTPNRKLLKGEEIQYPNYNGNSGGIPENVIYYNNSSPQDKNLKESTYLWVIDKDGNILILLEQTLNLISPRGHVCHTNITGGKEAYQGGELWFIDDTTIVINQKSGRYGGTEEQMKYIVEYFELSGYKVNIAN